MRQLFKAAFAALVLTGLAFAVPALGQTSSNLIPQGYCYNSSLSSASGLSTFTGSICNGINTFPNYNYAVFCAYSAAVNWRDDGIAPTTATGSGGQQLGQGQCMSYTGNFTTLQFIGSGATVGATIYKFK
jgi:hypothetical protein